MAKRLRLAQRDVLVSVPVVEPINKEAMTPNDGAPVLVQDVMIVNKNRSILFSEEINIDINGEISFEENSVLTEVS